MDKALPVLKAKHPQKKQELKSFVVKSWQSVTRQEAQQLFSLPDFMLVLTSRFCSQVLKQENAICDNTV